MIDQDGFLTFPLYHGTSTLYRDSIEKYGLGAKRDTSLFDFGILAQLAERLDATKNKTDWWLMNDFVVKAMIDQGVTRGGAISDTADFTFLPLGTPLKCMRELQKDLKSSRKFSWHTKHSNQWILMRLMSYSPANTLWRSFSKNRQGHC